MRKSLGLSTAAALCVVAAGWSVPAAAKSKVKYSDIVVVKKADKSSPMMMQKSSPNQATTSQRSRR